MKYSNRKLLVVAMVLLLAGCATKPVPPVILGPSTGLAHQDASPVSGKKLDSEKMTVEIDKSLLSACVAMPAMASLNPSPDDILAQKGEEVKIYADCNRRFKALIVVVKKGFNIP